MQPAACDCFSPSERPSRTARFHSPVSRCALPWLMGIARLLLSIFRSPSLYALVAPSTSRARLRLSRPLLISELPGACSTSRVVPADRVVFSVIAGEQKENNP